MAEERVVVSEKVCPKCGKTYRGHPAISRVDNVTAICPLCGTREALEQYMRKMENEMKPVGEMEEQEPKNFQ